MKPLAVIGDVHGYFLSAHRNGRMSTRRISYKKLLRDCQCNTIQLGDLGIFDSHDINAVNDIHWKQRDEFQDWRFRGNHDNPNIFAQVKGSLPDFGIVPGYDDIMYFAGANSIDKDIRTEGLDWWSNEELSPEQMLVAMDLYEKVKPRIVISHDCPAPCYHYLGAKIKPGEILGQNRTAQFLDNLFAIHKPEKWFFGHWHQARTFDIEGTMFRCVDELEAVWVVGGYDQAQE